MPCWYWDKKDLENSPSRKAGVTPENENRYRKEGSRFIYKLGEVLFIKLIYSKAFQGQGMKLHHDTLASAAVFYHRFYQIHSFSKFRSRYVTATCCLFLAGKVEETPKKWTGRFIHFTQGGNPNFTNYFENCKLCVSNCVIHTVWVSQGFWSESICM